MGFPEIILPLPAPSTRNARSRLSPFLCPYPRDRAEQIPRALVSGLTPDPHRLSGESALPHDSLHEGDILSGDSHLHGLARRPNIIVSHAEADPQQALQLDHFVALLEKKPGSARFKR